MSTRHSWARRQVRAAFRQFLRHNVWLLLGFLAAFVPVVGWALVFTGGWFQGFILGVAGSIYVGMAFALFVGVSGSMHRIVGSWGEDNTREVLRKARRRRLIAGWVDSIEIDTGDVDHLVLMRDGRYVAIDSKWHAVAVTDDVARRDVCAAGSNARRASLVLRSLKLGPAVVPLVVCWGAARAELQGKPQVIDGVEVMSGSDLKAWLSGATSASTPMDRAEARAQLAELKRFRDRVRPNLEVRRRRMAQPAVH